MILLVAAMTVVVVAGLLLWDSIWIREETDFSLMPPSTACPPAARDWLREQSIFFGHQSVGYDIVQGIREVISRRVGANLRIVETRNADEIRGPMLAHARIGRNGDPLSKIEEFQALMKGGLEDKVDIALFEFCYVDVGIRSNPDAIFASYCQAMDRLKVRFPKVTFVHVTVPMHGLPRTTKGRLKTSVMQRVGRPTELDENRARGHTTTSSCANAPRTANPCLTLSCMSPWGRIVRSTTVPRTAWMYPCSQPRTRMMGDISMGRADVTWENRC